MVSIYLVFIRNKETIFQNDCVILNPTSNSMRNPVAWNPHGHKINFYFSSPNWHVKILTVFLIWISLITSVVDIFSWLICQTYVLLREMCLHVFCPFSNRIAPQGEQEVWSGGRGRRRGNPMPGTPLEFPQEMEGRAQWTVQDCLIWTILVAFRLQGRSPVAWSWNSLGQGAY